MISATLARRAQVGLSGTKWSATRTVEPAPTARRLRKSQIAAITTACSKDFNCCSAIAGLRISIREMFHWGNTYAGKQRSRKVNSRAHEKARTRAMINHFAHAHASTRTRVTFSKQRQQRCENVSDLMQAPN